MITIRSFDSEAEKQNVIKCLGKISEPKKMKQAYTVARTIGNRLKQRWINSYTTTSLEIMSIDLKNKEELEKLFFSSEMLEFTDDATDVVSYGQIVGNSFVLEYFFDGSGEKRWRGNLEIEE